MTPPAPTSTAPPTPALRIALSGATGLIGSHLAPLLHSEGHHILRLVRRPPRHAGEIHLDLPRNHLDSAALEGLGAVIHLSGEPIMQGRWTKAKRERLRTSRVDSTRLIATALANLQQPPRVFIVASGAHYYGDRADEELTEDASVGSGFFPELVHAWEAAADPARAAGIRTVHLRLGMVLSRHGGALAPLLPLWKLGLGAVMGRGNQWWPWIALDDTIAAITHVMNRSDLRGPVNIAAPAAITAAEFAAALARACDRPLFARAPAPLLRIALGEKGELVTMSARIIPDKLKKSGFTWRWPSLYPLLQHEA